MIAKVTSPARIDVFVCLLIVLPLATINRSSATDPLRTALVVNTKSADSLTIANHYASLRRIPDVCIIPLDDVPDAMLCTVDEMRTRILQPLLKTLDQRGLGNQTDLIAYSADFPTAINLDADFAKVPKRHEVFTPVGSINGLTMLYQILGDVNVNYVSPRTNFYARADSSAWMQNPFLGPDQDVFNKLVAQADEKQYDEPIAALTSLLTRHPGQWPLRFRLAGYQVLAEKKAEAFESISQLIREGAALRPMFDKEVIFDAVRDDEDFAKLLAAMPAISPNRMPPVAFSARTTWGQNGFPVDATSGPRYLLSVVLAVTKGRGTTLGEAIEILARAAKADATGEKATFYFSNSSNVRAQTRMPLVPVAAVKLRELGHEVAIDTFHIPSGRQQLMGAMIGTSEYDWFAEANELLPGSIADNLTSTSGVLHQANNQTSMVELLRGGAAGTSGTVTEPYALQFKFPTPMMYPYYALGATLAEAFYLSVESPYQLLIVGDPLCRPYGDEHNELFTLEAPIASDGTLSLKLKFWRSFNLAAAKLAQLELFFAGKLVLVGKPAEGIRINTANLPPGWHEVTVAAISRHPMRMRSIESAYVLVGNESDCPTLVANSVEPKTVDAQASISATVSISGAQRIAIEHLGRRIIETAEIDKPHLIPITTTGSGPVRLTPFAERGGKWIPGKPVVVDVAPAS